MFPYVTTVLEKISFDSIHKGRFLKSLSSLYLMPHSPYEKNLCISQLVRVMIPALKERISFHYLKRAGRLRGYRVNEIHISDNGSNQIQWKHG